MDTGSSLKNLVILGSTGSIGRQTLDIVRTQPGFRVLGLAAGGNLDLLSVQVQEFRPALVAHEREGVLYPAPQHRIQYSTMEEMASCPEADLVMVGTVGRAGLGPTLAALRAGKTVAIANKEVLVMAGEIVTETAARYGGTLLPVDSEHSAIWQCLRGEPGDPWPDIRRLVLTASGGAFRDRSLESLAAVTPQQALEHPTWRMGPKITVDSATLMNKGFEMMEARWLFGYPWEKIQVMLHRESVVHSLVEYPDGILKAQLGLPDMRLPLQYALTYPQRWATEVAVTDFALLGSLTFQEVDFERYPCLGLALQTARAGGAAPAVLCAADEAAIAAFLAGRISFPAIYTVVEDTVEHHQPVTQPSLEDILEADRWARDHVERWLAKN